ncbi:hypothetical protein D3C73_868910 [compost metagenome]
MNFDIEVVDRHPILEIAIESVGLFDQKRPNCRVPANVLQHFVEAGAPALLGGFNVDKFPRHLNIVGIGVVFHQLGLSWDGKSFPILLLR